jgi:hypothetical protein
MCGGPSERAVRKIPRLSEVGGVRVGPHERKCDDYPLGHLTQAADGAYGTMAAQGVDWAASPSSGGRESGGLALLIVKSLSLLCLRPKVACTRSRDALP